MGEKNSMITRWERGDDCWTNIGSPDIVREQILRGYLETRGHGLSGLSGCKKNGVWLLCYGPSELLRQEGAAAPGFILRGCTNIPGGGGSTGILPHVWEREAREVGLDCQESFLHEAVCPVCGAEVSGDDGSGCGERVEVGLAYGEGLGQGVHAGGGSLARGAASAHSCCRSWGDRDRRGLVAERTYVSDYRQ